MIEFWKNLFKDSWIIYTQNIRLIMGSLILTFLPVLILPLIPFIEIQGNVDPDQVWGSIFQSLSFSEIFFIFSIQILMRGLGIGMLSILYNITSGKTTSIKDLVGKFYCLPKILFPDIIIGVIVFFSGIPIVTTIIYIIYQFTFFYYTLIIVTENRGIIDSINKSFNLTKNNISLILQFMIIVIFIGSVGLFFPLLILALFPIGIIIYINIYLQISKS